MLHEIDPAAFGSVRDLFTPLRFHLGSAIVIEGTKRGRVWVDDPENPRAGFLAGPSFYYLAGRPSEGFCRALNRLITEEIFHRDPLGHGRKAVRIFCHPEAWDEAMDDILAGRTPIVTRRRSYVYDLSKDPPEFPVPDGCALRAVDAEILADPAIEVHRFVVAPMERSYGSVERFLEQCFGCVAILDGKIVAWAPANDILGARCELGIVTEASYRRKGLGAATVAAALRLAKRRGMTEVSWHCDERNTGSVRVGERAGFTFDREYTCTLVVGDEAIHEEVMAKWKRGKMV